MRKPIFLTVAALLLSTQGWAQEPTTSETEKAIKDEMSSFIFTESQLDEDADVTQDVIQINSSSNMYTSNVGYLFSPLRFKYRALDQKYNDNLSFVCPQWSLFQASTRTIPSAQTPGRT